MLGCLDFLNDPKVMPNFQREFRAIETESIDVAVVVDPLFTHDLKYSLDRLHELALDLLSFCSGEISAYRRMPSNHARKYFYHHCNYNSN